MTQFAIGTLFMLSQEVYSDYKVTDVCRVLKPFDTREVVEMWLAIHPEQRPRYKGDYDGFRKWFIAQGYVEVIECEDWWLGSYSTFDADT